MGETVFVSKLGEGYYEEKKSRFLGVCFPIENEEDVAGILEAVRKKYWDARHNCYAFVLGDNNEITRCSDDGEPSGTAGKPILEVVLGRGVHNCLVVVTRYFGGTLLGTGGLVRAYTKAAADAIDNSSLSVKVMGSYLTINTDYNGLGKIEYMARNRGINIENITYTDVVAIEMAIPEDSVDAVIKEITELTQGKANIVEEKGKSIITDFSR